MELVEYCLRGVRSLIFTPFPPIITTIRCALPHSLSLSLANTHTTPPPTHLSLSFPPLCRSGVLQLHSCAPRAGLQCERCVNHLQPVTTATTSSSPCQFPPHPSIRQNEQNCNGKRDPRLGPPPTCTSVQGEDEGALHAVSPVLVLLLGAAQELHLPIRRHGGEGAEQASLRPGLRGDPQAAFVRPLPGPLPDWLQAPRPLPGGDPKEAGGSRGEAKVPGGAGAAAAGREARARAGGHAEGARREQQLQPRGRGEAAAEDGDEQGEPRGPAGRSHGASAREGEACHGGA